MTKPHLACDADLTKLKFPLMGFPKLDGVRGMHIVGSMTGRSLKAHGNKFVTEKYSRPEFEGFDGEFTFGDIRGESLCRDTTSVMSRIEGEPDVVWNLFDYLHPHVIDLPYIERYDALVECVTLNYWSHSHNITVIPFVWLHNIAEVEAFYQKCLDDGYEGCILRDPNGKHKDGRATVKVGAYLRMKPQSDKEAKVLRLVEAQENQNEAKTNELGRTERSSHKENKVGKGMVGMLVCMDDVYGEIDVGAGKMSHAEREYYWQNPDELIGKMVKYRSMDVGIKDKPRFARYISIRAESDIS